jgi:uncharacterized protein (DUF952 family)
MTGFVYKICSRAAWLQAVADGGLDASQDDIRDGYIHLSAQGQIAKTLAKHFEGRTDLVLLTIRAEDLGPALRWETSRGGALFPHLYGDLLAGVVHSVDDLPLLADGRHRLPERFRR